MIGEIENYLIFEIGTNVSAKMAKVLGQGVGVKLNFQWGKNNLGGGGKLGLS